MDENTNIVPPAEKVDTQTPAPAKKKLPLKLLLPLGGVVVAAIVILIVIFSGNSSPVDEFFTALESAGTQANFEQVRDIYFAEIRDNERLKAQYRERRGELFQAQLVTASDFQIVTRHSTGTYTLGMTITNNSDRVVTAFTIGILASDMFGLPVNSRTSTFGTYIFARNLISHSSTRTNLMPNEEMNFTISNVRFDSDISLLTQICIERAEFIDGTRWENPFFRIWFIENYFMFAGNPFL